MSNRSVPGVYRAIIEDVVTGVRPDFDEMGIDERVLSALKQSWEAKLAASGVADFEQDAAMAPFAQHAKEQKRMLQPAGPSASASGGSRGNKSSSSHSKSMDSKAASAAKSKPQENENELGSDLDDDDEEEGADADGLAAIDSGDFVIALYEKVGRVKNKWKIQLKDGVINADGKDYLFNKFNGDFTW